MRSTVYWSAAVLFGAGALHLGAIDINPSKDTIPRSSFDTGGNNFSIFNGDPKRIQRANAVDPKAFDSAVTLSPATFSLRTATADAPNPVVKITFTVHDHGKKTYTLSFPTAQRWDFRINDPSGKAVYVYSDNCDFEQKVGVSMVNHDDSLTYSELVQSNNLDHPFAPGTYTVEAVLSNYPEIKAQATLIVRP